MTEPVDDHSTVSLPAERPAPETLSARVSIVFFYREGTAVLEMREGRAVVVGRSFPADLVIADRSLSRLHARFSMSDGRLLLTDLDSTNGTALGGERIKEVELRPGAEIALGEVIALVQGVPQGEGARAGVDDYERMRERLREELKRAQAFRRSFALVMLRSSGTAPVARLAPELRRRCRPVDALGIHDGRTLLLLLPELRESEARERCAELVKSLPEAAALSIGIACFPDCASSEEELLSRCREACLRAQPGALPRVGSGALASPSALPPAPIVLDSAMRALHQTVHQVAARNLPVLIVGETGVGKEVIAVMLHECSRRKGPLRVINCATIPAQLVESTLFGHERGAFTGAQQRASGLFEDAQDGTVFLDEIGELSLAAQASLLRVVQEKRVMRVGSTREIAVDVRIVAATHRDLQGMVEQGRFRQDLLYRLNTLVLEVPPLRARRAEISALAQRFLEEARAQWSGSAERIAPEALALLENHHWPGNVRELRNVIERAVALCDRELIEPIDLPPSLRDAMSLPLPVATRRASAPVEPPGDAALDDTLFRDRVRDYELGLIRDALEKAQGNAPRAAELLRIPIRTLTYKLKAYGIRES